MSSCCCCQPGTRLHLILIQVKCRSLSAPRAQEILTQHGCQIKVRLGVHENEPDHGLIIVLVEGPPPQVEEMIACLKALPEVVVSSMPVPQL